jgi:DNA-binding SARP family transcriptional activator/streptogramin lyase
MPTVEIRLLGPLSVAVDGRPVDVGKGNERLLVAVLALAGGRPVSSEAIIDILWPDRAPRTAREMVRIYVSRVRSRLGNAAIETTGGGYALATDEARIDALRFERLATAAMRLLDGGDTVEGVAAIAEALSLWTGPALADLEGAAPFVRDERARLEELRLTLLEERADVELASGRSGRLVAELEGLVREHPYREGLRGRLMLALYRSGRQTDALAQFQDARSTLVEAFGVEPGRELHELQLAFLRQDPELDLPRHQPVVAGTLPRPPVRPRHARRRSLAALSVAVIATVVAVALFVTNNPRSARHGLMADSLTTLDALTGVVAQARAVHGFPTVVAGDGADVWFGDGRNDTISEVDDDLRTVSRSVRLSTFPYRLVLGLGSAWVADGYRGTVVRIDSATGRAARLTPDQHGLGRVQLALGNGSLWAASQDGTVTQTHGDGSSQIAATQVGRPEAFAYGFGDLWVAEATEDTLMRLSPSHPSTRRRIPIGGIGESIAVGAGSLWVATPAARSVWRIDPKTNSVVASIPIDGRPTVVVARQGAVWIGSDTGLLMRIEPRTNRVVQKINAHGPVEGLALSGNELLVTVS